MWIWYFWGEFYADQTDHSGYFRCSLKCNLAYSLSLVSFPTEMWSGEQVQMELPEVLGIRQASLDLTKYPSPLPSSWPAQTHWQRETVVNAFLLQDRDPGSHHHPKGARPRSPPTFRFSALQSNHRLQQHGIAPVDQNRDIVLHFENILPDQWWFKWKGMKI